MKVVGFAGYSGSGKTTLIEGLIHALKARGARVSVVKHAHHDFDIDHPGKDSYRHREAGAYEIVIASDRRLAKIREYDAPAVPTLASMLAELSSCDWVLVEGFKAAALPKIEVWRAANGKPVQYPSDPRIVAVATDEPASLPEPTALPVLALSDVAAVAEFLWSDAERYEYVATAAKAAAEAAAEVADAHAGRGAGASGRRGPAAGR